MTKQTATASIQYAPTGKVHQDFIDEIRVIVEKYHDELEPPILTALMAHCLGRMASGAPPAVTHEIFMAMVEKNVRHGRYGEGLHNMEVQGNG